MMQTASSVLETTTVDAIWATARNNLVHAVADRISHQYSIPWIADFRDLTDQTYQSKRVQRAVVQEIKTCASANVITATTEEHAAKLRARHHARVHTIFNGFDPDDYPPLSTPIRSDVFDINHFGKLYEYRKPTALLAALDLLVARDPRFRHIRVHFYGADKKLVTSFAEGHNCSTQVSAPARLPYHDMIKRQQNSQVLLVVAPPEQGGAIPAKLYSYLASRRPILSVPGDTAGTDRIINETDAGIVSGDPENIASWITEKYTEWEANGAAGFTGKDSEIHKYSRKSQAKQFADLLNSVKVPSSP